VPLERDICLAALDLKRLGTDEFHGYQLAKRLREGAGRRLLTAYGTLYRALDRLETMGQLASRWEDAAIPARENRPGRRLYTLTVAGHTAAIDARRLESASTPRRARRRVVPA
jgi:DNA-binding PadR family transcriptional regulator